MSTKMNTSETPAANPTSPEPRYRRRLRNYLIDGSLQLRYTGFIIMIAVLLTGVLGQQIYNATRGMSEIIVTSGLADPDIARDLQLEFQANDRVVLWGIIGFGAVLVLSIALAGIWITHKVAGPLFNMSAICVRVRDNKLSPSLRQLRKGDELQDFYSSFRDMYEALRGRVNADIGAITLAIAALEAMDPKTPAALEALESLHRLRKEKEQSLATTG